MGWKFWQPTPVKLYCFHTIFLSSYKPVGQNAPTILHTITLYGTDDTGYFLTKHFTNSAMTYTLRKYHIRTQHTIPQQTFHTCSYAVQDVTDNTCSTVQSWHDDSVLSRLVLHKPAHISLDSIRHIPCKAIARTGYNNFCLILSTMGNERQELFSCWWKTVIQFEQYYLYLHWEYFASSLLLLHVWWASTLNPLWQMCPSASVINWYSSP